MKIENSYIDLVCACFIRGESKAIAMLHELGQGSLFMLKIYCEV